MTARGPEYADRLTEAERHTLDVLVAEVGRRNASHRPSRRAPIAAGLAALVILLAVAVVSQLGAAPSPPPDSPAASGTIQAPSAAGVFQDLAAAAAGASPPDPDRGKDAYRKRLDMLVSANDGSPGSCQVTAVTIETWEPIEYLYLDAAAPPGPGRLSAGLVEPPPPALVDCATATFSERSLPLPFEGGLVEGWETLSYALGAQAPRPAPLRIIEHGPAAVTPRTVDEFVGRADAPQVWWVELLQLLASPQPDPGTVVAALEVAAERAAGAPEGTVEALGPGTDVTGRPGVGVRVPYASDGAGPATAEVRFDPDTGALRQLVVPTGRGTEITVFLAIQLR